MSVPRKNMGSLVFATCAMVIVLGLFPWLLATSNPPPAIVLVYWYCVLCYVMFNAWCKL